MQGDLCTSFLSSLQASLPGLLRSGFRGFQIGFKKCEGIRVLFFRRTHVTLIDLVKSFPTSIQYLVFTCKNWLRSSRETSPPKFAKSQTVRQNEADQTQPAVQPPTLDLPGLLGMTSERMSEFGMHGQRECSSTCEVCARFTMIGSMIQPRTDLSKRDRKAWGYLRPPTSYLGIKRLYRHMIKNIAKSERIHIQILEWTYRQISLSFERHNIFLYIPKVESIWIFSLIQSRTQPSKLLRAIAAVLQLALQSTGM